jgi:membrane associated rhomboid family serine protease
MNGFTRISNNTSPVVKNLIYINVILLLATWVMKSRFDYDLTTNLGLYYPESPNFKPYQLVTHMFMHGGLTHIFFNMFALWMFGNVLESVWGSKRFLLYYMVCGLGAAVIQTGVSYLHYSYVHAAMESFASAPSPDLYLSLLKKFSFLQENADGALLDAWVKDPTNPLFSQTAILHASQFYSYMINIPMVGASGAIFGVLLAFGMLFPNTELMLLFPPIPIKAKWFVAGYGAIELFFGLTQPGSDIAHFAHLGGMLFGFFMIKYWNAKRTTFY